jgi:hypothetical protein
MPVIGYKIATGHRPIDGKIAGYKRPRPSTLATLREPTSANGRGVRCGLDYSASGEAWNYLNHDYSRSRAYRWSDDGLAPGSVTWNKECARACDLERRSPDPEGAVVRSEQREGNQAGRQKRISAREVTFFQSKITD